MKICTKCNLEYPIEEFYNSKVHQDGKYPWCRKCKKQNYAANHSEKNKAGIRFRKYGITAEQFQELRVKQNFCCAICGEHESNAKDGRAMNVDHNHETGEVRSLLCKHCNVGLGSFREDIDTMLKAISYIKKWSK